MTRAAFALTLFTSATLLFALEPLVARLLLPLLGGAPAVWIVCSLCFQSLILAGYATAHVVGSRARLPVQVAIMLALVALAFFALPVTVDGGWARGLLERHPSAGLIVLLLRTAGLPFLVLATTSPLLQRWFAEHGETDPYHLYVASNAGSMLALLGYPLAIEPLFGTGAQAGVFSAGFAVYALFVALIGLHTSRNGGKEHPFVTPAPPLVAAEDAPPSAVPSARPTSRWQERATWVFLAAVPSSLLLGATDFVTTDVASMPLLWVVPLALYLASFMVAFAKTKAGSPAKAARALGLLAALLVATRIAEVGRPAWLLFLLHFGFLFAASVVCHQALAARRPRVTRLTEFYLAMSVGGALGGLFNGLVAPSIFSRMHEYPIAIGLAVLASSLVREPGRSLRPTRRDLALVLGLLVLVVALVRAGVALGVDPKPAFAWMFGVPLLIAFSWSARPVRYGLALLAIEAGATTYGGLAGVTLQETRSFFGSLRVTELGEHRMLVYGRTMHGVQSLHDGERRVPRAYYHPTGPAGDVLGPLGNERLPGGRRIGVIGLGIGSLAAYARPADAFTFFDINPDVERFARTYFTFLADASARATVGVVIGDARLRLQEVAPASFEVLVLDAFSSDAIPVHLVTREALATYRRVLTPDGVLLAHVSNQHVRLGPVFGRLGADAGMVVRLREDLVISKALDAAGKAPSTWVLLAPNAAIADRVLRGVEGGGREAGWVEAPAAGPVWTDDHANVLGAIAF